MLATLLSATPPVRRGKLPRFGKYNELQEIASPGIQIRLLAVPSEARLRDCATCTHPSPRHASVGRSQQRVPELGAPGPHCLGETRGDGP